MSSIDIRKQEVQGVTDIIFADVADPIELGERTDIAYKLNRNSVHKKHIFIEASVGEYICIRKSDVDNLIKALQQAKTLGWI